MKKGLLYIHGRGGAAEEAAHYRALFPDHDVVGLDYRAQTPWDAREEFRGFYDRFRAGHDRVTVVANSIGAYFAMAALGRKAIEKACFISPIVDMERLIADMMRRSGVSERELRQRGTVATASGETLSWDYLAWTREHPIEWEVPTAVLYGARDELQPADAIRSFAARTGARVTVMENGEHWFHTPAQMAFLDDWIRSEIPVS